ncbi:MAG: UDP-N-acetylglucosamine 2-epimerase (hydrolyzing) [Nitrosomonadales bacterium]|nr:UDP-N-acetylglucosamine 2-epimerase (hydrolyzing) [Nitrosomonadales bacterium]|tara:strand:+ start:45 stop:1214 length:1170 start_codon:yes stop_codon:yes gene_type:complete
MNKLDFRRICVVTSSRADYGLLKKLMKNIKTDKELILQTVVTGTHLSFEYGMTYREIENDGFKIDRKVKILSRDNSSRGLLKSMANCQLKFPSIFSELKPDLIIVLGDRFEIFAVTSVALIECLPIAHLHGGELTEGAIDEAFRHSITKMSHIHFVANDIYKKRVIQLGEQPSKVFNVGGLGVDSINSLMLIKRDQLENDLGFEFKNKNYLITFHSETLESDSTEKQFLELLKVLRPLKETGLIFTLPNSDTGSLIIIKLINKFVSNNLNAIVFKSLGQLHYLSCMSHMDGVIGNSSSGLLEAPSFKIPTINIGDRQKGRLQASSVINCRPERSCIEKAIKKLDSKRFLASLKKTVNPYGKGGASKKIISIIKNQKSNGILKKQFFDLN